jgi:GT2 family glycosyltransferase
VFQISIVVLNWNSEYYLLHCLDTLKEQSFNDFETLVIDNGSDKNISHNLYNEYPELNLRVEKLTSNIGFAAANNIGARLARGKWLALLNADAFPEPDWLENLLDAAETIPKAFFASRQIQANNPKILDGEGDAYHISGLAWRRNYGSPVQEKYSVEEIFSSCAAAALYPRQAFLDAGGFDEDYFAYHEDIDLGFRLRLRGLRCFLVPNAVVHHVGSASTGKHSDFAIYHGHRNLVWTYLKNMPKMLLWIFLPLHLVANLATLVRFSLSGHGKAIWRAKLDAVKGLGSVLAKRNHIQRNREVSISAIYRIMERSLLAPLRVSIQRRRYGSD